jgi:hypothetical protein
MATQAGGRHPATSQVKTKNHAIPAGRVLYVYKGDILCLDESSSLKGQFLKAIRPFPPFAISKPVTPRKTQRAIAVKLVAVDVGVDGLQPFKTEFIAHQ